MSVKKSLRQSQQPLLMHLPFVKNPKNFESADDAQVYPTLIQLVKLMTLVVIVITFNFRIRPKASVAHM